MTARDRLNLTRYCLKEAEAARARIPALIGKGAAFDRGYFLGLAHAYELLLQHRSVSRHHSRLRDPR